MRRAILWPAKRRRRLRLVRPHAVRINASLALVVPAHQALRPEKVLWGLIGANVSVYGLWQVADTSFMRRHFTVRLRAF